MLFPHIPTNFQLVLRPSSDFSDLFQQPFHSLNGAYPSSKWGALLERLSMNGGRVPLIRPAAACYMSFPHNGYSLPAYDSDQLVEFHAFPASLPGRFDWCLPIIRARSCGSSITKSILGALSAIIGLMLISSPPSSVLKLGFNYRCSLSLKSL